MRNPQSNNDRISINEVPQSVKNTMLKMHRGLWSIKEIASYLRGMTGRQLSDNNATRILKAMESKEEYEMIEEQRRAQRISQPGTDLGYYSIDRSAQYYAMAGRFDRDGN